MFTLFERTIMSIISSKGKKLIAILLTGILFFASVWMIQSEKVLAKMLPGKDNNNFSVYVKTKTGSSISQTKEVTDCVVETALPYKEVINIETFLGTAGPLDFAGLIREKSFNTHENNAEIVINLTNKRDREKPSFNLVQELRKKVLANCDGKLGDTDLAFVEPPAGPPVLAAIVAEVYSDKPSNREEIAKIVENAFKTTDGLVDVDILSDTVVKKYELEVNYDKLVKSGLSIEQVNKILYLSFEGMKLAVDNSIEKGKQVPLFLRFGADKTYTGTSIAEVRNKLQEVRLMNSMGMHVPLLSVVEIKESHSNPVITNKNLKEMTNVVAETDMVSQVYPLMEARLKIFEAAAEKWVIEKNGIFDFNLINRETGETVSVLWGGEMKVSLDTFRDLGIAFIAALGLIFLLMVIYYKSFVLSGIVLAGSFLSIIGVIFGHWIVDLVTPDTFFLTATSLIGFIALIGISSRNSLLLIDFTKQLHRERGCDFDTAISHATAVRAKPIFLTATAIILASTLLASDAVFGGLGIALIFGTITAVIASLIVVPILLSMSNLDKHFGH